MPIKKTHLKCVCIIQMDFWFFGNLRILPQQYVFAHLWLRWVGPVKKKMSKIISDRFFLRGGGGFFCHFNSIFLLTNSICAAVSNSNIRLSAILNGICGINKLKKSKLTNLQNSEQPFLGKAAFVYILLLIFTFFWRRGSWELHWESAGGATTAQTAIDLTGK